MQFSIIAKHILVNAVHSSRSPVVFSQQPFQTSLLEPLEELQFLLLWHWLQFQPEGLLMGSTSVSTQVSVLIYCCMVWILLLIHILNRHTEDLVWQKHCYCKSSDCSLRCEILKDHVKSYKGCKHNNFVVFRLVIRRKDKSQPNTERTRPGISGVNIKKCWAKRKSIYIHSIIKLTTYNIKEYQDYKPLNIHQVAGNPGVEFS